MFNEFRLFINRGNVIDLAVAVVMGAAFGAIVTSLVNDIIMPTVKVFTQWLNFSTLALHIGAAQIVYGNFIQAVLTFLLVAWVCFLLVRTANQMQAQLVKEKPPPATPTVSDNQLLIEIRDLLQSRLPSPPDIQTSQQDTALLSTLNGANQPEKEKKQ